MNQMIKKRIEEINSGRVPEGYKQTPFGIFPHDWTNCSIAELSEVIDGDRGKNYPKENEFHENGFCLFLNAGNVTENGFCFNYNQFITEEKSNKLRKGKLQDNDIVITTRGTVGNFALFSNEISYRNIRINSGMAIIRHNEMSNTDYLSCYLKSFLVKNQIKRICFGSAQPQLTIPNIKGLQIGIPKYKTEQGKIAEILMKWDEMVELQDQYLKKLEIRKKAVMKKLLTPKADWESVKLGKIAEMYAGGTPSTKNKEYWGGEIPWIQSGLIQNNYIELKNIDARITEKGLQNSSTAWIKKGSILIAITGAICANIAYLKCDATANQSVMSITTDAANTLFLYFYMQNARLNLLALQNGSAQGGLTLKYLENFDVYLPEIKQQNIIADILLTVDQEISLQKEKLDKIKTQRKILQQYLLTGIVRVEE